MKHRSKPLVPKHRKDAVTWSSEPEARERMLRAPFCGYCGKLLLASEADARSYIGLLVRKTPHRHNGYALRPYRCPRKPGWHVGRDSKAVAFLEGKR